MKKLVIIMLVLALLILSYAVFNLYEDYKQLQNIGIL